MGGNSQREGSSPSSAEEEATLSSQMKIQKMKKTFLAESSVDISKPENSPTFLDSRIRPAAYLEIVTSPPSLPRFLFRRPTSSSTSFFLSRMPSVSSLLPDDKSRIKRSIPSGNKILTATVARIFYQKGHEWDYSGIQGGLCLVVDKQRGGVWWKVVDLMVSWRKRDGLYAGMVGRGGEEGRMEGRRREREGGGARVQMRERYFLV